MKAFFIVLMFVGTCFCQVVLHHDTISVHPINRTHIQEPVKEYAPIICDDPGCLVLHEKIVHEHNKPLKKLSRNGKLPSKKVMWLKIQQLEKQIQLLKKGK